MTVVPGALNAARSLRRREVLRHDLHRAPVLRGRAELDDVRPGLDDRHVSGRRVVGVARLVGLLVIGVAERHPAARHVAPVRALAVVVGQPLEQRSRIGVLAERLEPHRVPAELLVAALHHAHVLDLRGALLGSLGHRYSSLCRQ